MKVVIIGGGPAGNTCATSLARLGAEVVLVENTIMGGAAHVLDCIPSKAMISMLDNRAGSKEEISLEELTQNIQIIDKRLTASLDDLLTSQGVEIINGFGKLNGQNEVLIETEKGELSRPADVVVLSTGSSPRIPDWCKVDGKKIFTTRQVYPPPEIPSHIVIVGSGVTGVEMTHMFDSLGSQVTLLVSRQQVLPTKDPEVAAILERDFEKRGIKLLRGARAVNAEVNADGGVSVYCEDGRKVDASHMLLAVGAIPNSQNMGLEEAGVETQDGYVNVDRHLRSNVPHIYAAGDLAGKLHLSSIATSQGKKIAEHAMGQIIDRPHRHIDYDKAATAIFTEPEIADVGLAEVDAYSEGRKVYVVKVPFAVSARAVIQNDTRGFIKIVADHATGVVLGGSIIGKHASELIASISLAVTAGLTVRDLVDTISVHPSLAEMIFEAAD